MRGGSASVDSCGQVEEGKPDAVPSEGCYTSRGFLVQLIYNHLRPTM